MMSSLRGDGGISQNMTIDDKGGTDDGDGIEKKVKDIRNHP